MTRCLIGLDDTDNLESRGTGHRARMLGDELSRAGLARLLGITRHQLLVSPLIPYTSHNSSACVEIETPNGDLGAVWDFCRQYLLRESAEGSDAGLCLAQSAAVPDAVRSFGQRAKQEVLDSDQARWTAEQAGFRLEGLTGTGGGIIGSLAAVGLRSAGADGRYLWLPELRQLEPVLSAGEVKRRCSIGSVRPLEGADLPDAAIIHLNDWVRPVLRNHQPVLFVEEVDHEWYVLAKESVKRLSD